MPTKRKLTMRQLRHMLRLAGDGTSTREIAHRLGIARTTVQDNLKRAAAAGLSWPLTSRTTRWRTNCFPDPIDSASIEAVGFDRSRTGRNWQRSSRSKKPGVTLLILWEEYRAVHPDGYGYSRFCELYRSFERRLSPSMRQEHIAGEKVFVG